MRKNIKKKAYLYPMPVLIIGTYDEHGTPNAMNAAWGTVCDTDMVALVLSAGHKTVKNLLTTKAFTVSMADIKNLVPADFVGIVSGNTQPNKLDKTGWHTQKSEFINAPVITELPLCLECELVSYDTDSEICIGRVVNASADEGIIGSDGKIDLQKFTPICYDCDGHGYYALGERVGNAFSDGLKLK